MRPFAGNCKTEQDPGRLPSPSYRPLGDYLNRQWQPLPKKGIHRTSLLTANPVISYGKQRYADYYCAFRLGSGKYRQRLLDVTFYGYIVGRAERYTVLYIEDNDTNRQLVEFILGRKDHLSLTCAVDGQSGLVAAKCQLPDLILMDISLPDITGYEVLAALKEDPATEHIPVIAISGDYPSENAEQGRFSFDRYMTKPIQVEPLCRTIDEILQH